MSKSVLRRATEEATHRPDRKLPPGVPRWVKVLAIIALVLFLLFVILRLSGMIDHGSGSPMHMSTPIHLSTIARHGGQEL